jgi:hypothetical protein
MSKRKTIPVSGIVEKANFDILMTTYVHGKKTVALAKWDFAQSTILAFDAYNGFSMWYSTQDVEKFIRKYNSEHNYLYSEAELQMVVEAHNVALNRIADMWYNQTGNALPDVVDDGMVKDNNLYREWIQFSAKHFQDENWVTLH